MLQKIPFTEQAYKKMQQRFSVLKQELVEVMERLKVAREMGDLSENGAYKYAKFEIGRIKRELRTVRDLLQRGEVTLAVGGDRVAFGSSVTVRSDRGSKTYQMVSEYESDLTQNKLSLTSPIGSALSNHTVGETVSFESPRGTTVLTIEKIE